MLKDQKARDIAEKDFNGNFLVSAGAGCGKTRVLSTRIFNIVKEFHKQIPDIVSRLLVLTFTNKAAAEMKSRTRQFISADDETKYLSTEVEAADITTFDAFALSIVKKYRHQLGIRGEVQIGNEQVLKVQRYKILKKVLDSYYADALIYPNSLFAELIKKYCISDDEPIVKYILDILTLCETKPEGYKLLDDADKKFFNDEFVDELLKQLYEHAVKMSNKAYEIIDKFDSDAEEFANKFREFYDGISKAPSFDALVDYLSNTKAPRAPRGLSEENVSVKEELQDFKDEIIKIVHSKTSKEIKETYFNNKKYTELLFDIAKKVGKECADFKAKYCIYTFNDIFKLAFKLVSEHNEVREELANKYKFILIDEYQDTNSIQEAFINLIARDNVFEVGDIKQAIYGFRGGNCDLFAEKYARFAGNNGGRLLTLTENFRTRKTIIDEFNELFAKLMINGLGGCIYSPNHLLGHGRTAYDSTENEENRLFEVYSYQHENKRAKENEEAILVVNDIISKIKNGYRVVDENFVSRPCEFKDFAILMYRKRDFFEYQKVFNEYGIPLDCVDMTTFEEKDAINVLLNICRFVCELKYSNNEQRQRLYFASILRSFVVRIDSDQFHEVLTSGHYKDTVFYEDIKNNADLLVNLNVVDALNWILNYFNFYENLNFLGDIKVNYERIQDILSQAKTGATFGWNLKDFVDYFDSLAEFDLTPDTIDEPKATDAVRLMSIHSSKGLEFPIVYMPQLHFQIKEKKEKWVCSDKFGFIIPEEKDEDNVLQYARYLKIKEAEFSEKLRLFYVGITRAKEKVIFVVNKDKINLQDNVEDCENYTELLKIANYINDANTIEKSTNPGEPLDEPSVEGKVDLSFPTLIDLPAAVEKNPYHASKTISEPIDPEILRYGTKLHRLLELSDLNTKDISWMDKDEQSIVSKVMSLDIFKDTSDAKIYHEYMFEDEESKLTGIIDLLMVYPDHIDIIDFKTSNIDDPEYGTQLATYEQYISKVFKQPINKYLLSIKEGRVKKV